MKSRTRFKMLGGSLSLTALALLAAAGIVFAADLPLAPKQKLKGEQAPPGIEANCIAYTDGCRNFARGKDNAFAPLNNIGVACQPQKPVCTQRR